MKEKKTFSKLNIAKLTSLGLGFAGCASNFNERSVLGNESDVNNINFTLEKPTQSCATSLKIVQSDEKGLTFYIVRNEKISEVPKHMISGLPKLDFIPESFFKSLYATVNDDAVRLTPALKGGAKEDISALIKALKANLEDDYEDDLSGKDVDLLLRVFEEMVNMKKDGASNEELNKFVSQELQKHENKEQLGKAFTYMAQRAEGKYNGYFGLILGIAAAFAGFYGW